jgi:hypothetical protein
MTEVDREMMEAATEMILAVAPFGPPAHARGQYDGPAFDRLRSARDWLGFAMAARAKELGVFNIAKDGPHA